MPPTGGPSGVPGCCDCVTTPIVNCGTGSQPFPAVDLVLDFTYRRIHYQSSGTPTCDDIVHAPIPLVYNPPVGATPAFWLSSDVFIEDYPSYKHFDESDNLVFSPGHSTEWPETGYHRFRVNCISSFFGFVWNLNHFQYKDPVDPINSGTNYTLQAYTQTPFYARFTTGSESPCPATNTIPANFGDVQIILTQP